LASWVAFSLRADVDETKQREFITNMTELYRWRGTEKNMIRLFKIFTGREPVLQDIPGNAEPHYFKVRLNISELVRGKEKSETDRQINIAHALIRLEKPAHTRYKLELMFPSFRIGSQETLMDFKTQVGKNTRLGVAEWSN
jgi:hypothetical protein